MRSKISFLERIRLVLVGTVAVVGITTGAAFATIFEFTIDEDATLAPGGLQIVVTGTLHCTGDIAIVRITVAQDRGQQTAIAEDATSNSFGCDGTLQTWVVTTTTDTPFKNGPAGVRGEATVIRIAPMGTDTATAANRLHLH
jgi:hypothetical protein